VRFDTIGGVVHAINSGDGLWSTSDRWRVDPTRVVEIGAVDGAEPYVFGQVAGVAIGDDGRIYVADGHATEIRVFSPEGEFVTRFGRKGEGPGEFLDISGLGLGPQGGIAVLDGRLGRVSLFDADGKFSRSFRLERPYLILEYGALVRFDEEGRFYDRTSLSSRIGTDTVGIVRYAADGRVEDTILTAVHVPSRILVQRGGVPVMSMPVPFAPKPISTVGPNGSIYATDGEAYSIARLTPTGDTLLVIRRDVTPSVVSAAERDSALAEIRKLYREAAGTEPRDLPPIPDRKPAIAALHVDEKGHLWVLRPSDDDVAAMEWDIFDPEGYFLGTLTMPPMDVMHIGDRAIAGVFQDELGVARVRVVSLDRGPDLP
jgi:hypothetical protein